MVRAWEVPYGSMQLHAILHPVKTVTANKGHAVFHPCKPNV
jgi:hypothetical protein